MGRGRAMRVHAPPAYLTFFDRTLAATDLCSPLAIAAIPRPPVTLTSPPTFTYQDTSAILRLDHPLFDAEWTVRPACRIDFTHLASRSDGTEWMAAQPHEPIALVGIEGRGHRFHFFDQPREFW